MQFKAPFAKAVLVPCRANSEVAAQFVLNPALRPLASIVHTNYRFGKKPLLFATTKPKLQTSCCALNNPSKIGLHDLWPILCLRLGNEATPYRLISLFQFLALPRGFYSAGLTRRINLGAMLPNVCSDPFTATGCLSKPTRSLNMPCQDVNVSLI